MRRFSLLAFVVSASLLGALVIGSASASATVLCKSAPAAHQCPPGDVYGLGTKIQWELAPETELVISTLSGGYINSCSSWKTDLTVGGLWEQLDEAGINENVFGGCKYPIENQPSFNVSYFTWTSGTHAGTVSQVSVIRTSLGPIAPNYMCRYVLSGPAKLVPGSAPQLAFGEDSYGYEANGNGFLCPKKVRFTATYNITTPTPLYLEQN